MRMDVIFFNSVSFLMDCVKNAKCDVRCLYISDTRKYQLLILIIDSNACTYMYIMKIEAHGYVTKNNIK